MVQLFNIPKMELIIKENLLGKFIYVFKMILKYSLVRGTINVEHEVIKQKVYLRPQGDLRLIVSHPCVAIHVLNDRLDVFEEILEMVTYLQVCNHSYICRSL
jgi:hypothetical protein